MLDVKNLDNLNTLLVIFMIAEQITRESSMSGQALPQTLTQRLEALEEIRESGFGQTRESKCSSLDI